MKRKRCFRQSDLDELEAHLRDVIDDLTASGSSPDEAFATAVRQLGDADSLSDEFYKIHFREIWGKRVIAVAAVFAMLLAFLPQYAGEVRLTTKSAMMDTGGLSGTDFLDFREKAYRPLILPDTDNEQVHFFDLWLGDSLKAGMVIQRADHDLIYIDANGDENLTNDGAPKLFLLSENELRLQIPQNFTKNVTVEVSLTRNPPEKYAPSINRIFDDNGELQPSFVALVKMYPEYNGGKRSYYFVERNVMKRGIAKFGDMEYTVALVDLNCDGIYNNPETDYLLIDFGRDGRLTLYDHNEMMKLDEVFRVNGQNYRLTDADPLGETINIEKTNQPQSFDYLNFIDSLHGDYRPFQDTIGTVPDIFWQTSVVTFSGKTIDFGDLRNRYIFLNILPETDSERLNWPSNAALVIAAEEFPVEKLVVLTLFKTETGRDLDFRNVMQKIHWPTGIMPKAFDSIFDFNITKGVLNVLIKPDGQAVYVRQPGGYHFVTRDFFFKNID
ncbi:MAG: permease prefix domain 1-containing protein [Calditrichia bacterium]